MFAGIATTLLNMITPQATAILIDQAIPDADRQLLYQLAMGLFATTLGATMFQLTQGIAIRPWHNRSVYRTLGNFR